jgi:hypothetical protein
MKTQPISLRKLLEQSKSTSIVGWFTRSPLSAGHDTSFGAGCEV